MLDGLFLTAVTNHMTYGSTLIMKAPGCRKPVKIETTLSGNTFRSTYWTDGKREAPMLPDEPWLRKSPTEGILFWTDECEEIGKMHAFGEENGGKEKWEEVEYAVTPSEADYLAALTSGIANTEEKMRYVRKRLWWTGNDRIRRGDAQPLSEVHVRNLEALALLLPEADPINRLMKAEAMRELSRFDEALSLLAKPFPDQYSSAVKRIRELAASKNATVAKLR